MLINQAMEKLAQMKLEGFLDGLREQMGSPAFGDMPFEDRLGLLVDREYTLRENRRLTRRLQETRLKTRADVEDVDFRAKRGLDKRVYLELAGCSWISRHHNLIITGPTGVGKSYLACALGRKACREGYRSIYYRFSDFIRERPSLSWMAHIRSLPQSSPKGTCSSSTIGSVIPCRRIRPDRSSTSSMTASGTNRPC